jgi:hypothetical protein
MQRMDEEPRRERGERSADREELLRATESVIARLTERKVSVFGGESPEELVTLLEAVERFEAFRAARGGDSFTNTPGSAEPDDPRFVLPERRETESAREYIRRVDEAALKMRRGD